MAKISNELPQNEGYHIEFKNFREGVSVKELSKTICAFANTEGGSVYLGVTDSRQISVIKNTQKGHSSRPYIHDKSPSHSVKNPLQ